MVMSPRRILRNRPTRRLIGVLPAGRTARIDGWLDVR
jgi:hypothetical protein